MPFRKDIDPESDAYFDKITQEKRCRHRMMWMINKVRHRKNTCRTMHLTQGDQGAVISEDTSAKHPLSMTHRVKKTDLKIELRLYSCDDDEPVQRRSTVGRSLNHWSTTEATS